MSGCSTVAITTETQQQAPFEFLPPAEQPDATEPLNSVKQESTADAALVNKLSADELAPPTRWVESFQDPLLTRWVDNAIGNNFDLLEAKARVEAAQQQRRIAGAPLWPSMDLGLNGQRQKNNRTAGTTDANTSSNASQYRNNFQAGVDIAWEVDLWGKLGDSLDAADYRWQAEQALFDSSRLSIAAQVARAWYNVTTQHLLTKLFQERVDNLSTNLDVIQSGYRQGINAALDVYLARTDLAGERSNLLLQQAIEIDAIRQLQLLSGQYPSGALPDLANYSWQLPPLTALDTEALNAQTVRHRYDLQASFLELLASDKDLAAAHKARFPSFRLTGSVGDSSDEFDQLFDPASLAWNLLGNLSQPLFAGGRLKAQEQQQLAIVQQKEQQYLKTLHTAFSEVEQAITNESSLKAQLQQVRSAKELAEAAEELAFEEYRQGLQDYTSVLEAQRRAFNAQNTYVSIRNQLLQNRISLFLALGGDYR
nr:efflux transporter outer membrane subunit [Aestuariicella hydrocarbonica]